MRAITVCTYLTSRQLFIMEWLLVLYLLAFTFAEDIEITASVIKGQRIQEIDWCGEMYDNAFIRTNTGSIYRSEDKGKSFTSITKRLITQGQNTLDSDEVGFAKDMIVSESNPNTLAIIGTSGANWITDNCGRTWKVIDTNNPIKNQGGHQHLYIFKHLSHLFIFHLSKWRVHHQYQSNCQWNVCGSVRKRIDESAARWNDVSNQNSYRHGQKYPKR